MPYYKKRQPPAGKSDMPRPPTCSLASADEAKAMNRRRQAVLEFMAGHDLSPTELARRAGLTSPNGLYNFLKGRSSSLSQKTLERIATAFPDTTVDSLSGLERADGGNEAAPDTRLVAIEMAAAAGTWRTSTKAGANLRGHTAVPAHLVPRNTNLFGVRVCEPGAEQLYPPGTILVCRPLMAGETVGSGCRLIVHRRNRGQHEVTVREAVNHDGRVWLCSRSSDPGHQAPVAISSVGSGLARIRGYGIIDVIGIVLATWQPELSAADK